MKKFKGQNTVQLVLTGAISLGVAVGGVYMLGGNLKTFFKGDNPAKTFNDLRTNQMENSEDLVSNTTVYLGNTGIKSPVEEVVKLNLLNGSYVQTSGSSGKLKEITQFMKQYTSSILSQVPINGEYTGTPPSGEAGPLGQVTAEPPKGGPITPTPYSRYVDAINAYKTVIDTTMTKITPSGKGTISDFQFDLAMLDMLIQLDSKGALATELKSAFDAYMDTLPLTYHKRIVQIYTNDLLNFTNGIKYSINNSLYTEVLGESSSYTLAQNQALVDKMNADYASKLYNSEKQAQIALDINIIPSQSISTLAPNTYNNKAICTSLGIPVNKDNKCTLSFATPPPPPRSGKYLVGT